MEKLSHPRPLIVRGQNSGLYQEQYRQYYGIFRVERAPRPNTHGDTILVQIAENCTKEDADELVAAYHKRQAAEEIARALQTINGWSKCQCREKHGDNFNCCVLIAEAVLSAWEKAGKGEL